MPQILGVSVDALTMDDLHRIIGKIVSNDEKAIIANHNLHSLYIYHHDARMREFYKLAKYAHIDGMPIVFLGQRLGFQLERRHRVTYVDWIRPLMKEAVQNHWRVFFLGSKPGVGEKAAELLSSEFPGLKIHTHHGYFDITPESVENQSILEQIRRVNPHLLLVGMGMPRQERWILENLNDISANVILPAGACMDYVAGVVPTPPRWMGQVGLEWLYRLFSEPKRLWRRYLIEPWFILRLFLKELVGNRAHRQE
ncbi:WecB/TagA/CpsF family glycosyltransferase [Lihuaxuella thermophila]|uniref:N-acetylglucosaminyldiphosphoundecaprenol N-acetyl-beta-D-mannosaminyltransferase n=1 Tax=Lihuaxuella thermophila TaxID=1173111 RepID=A0A1H8CDZ1_9BACL|nr:WecB/TagA/CpsF family glycosyltransferase [Lihuaxuella thermophila]SEM93481.1 N-acetylglucosaminyldiphosphoundecaprenol N-acetyl-beta-D-mannosaminyltransferase [Lihuaxuella thermophila]